MKRSPTQIPYTSFFSLEEPLLAFLKYILFKLVTVMDKQTMVCLYNGVLPSNKRDLSSHSCYIVDAPKKN